jgi:hypothetical protein
VKRVVWAGGAVFGIYALIALATLAWSGHVVRPLFEGVGPPPAYNWVAPPAQFAATNTVPKPKDSDIPFKCQSPGAACTTGAAVAATDDGQFVVNFADSSLPSHAPDTKVHTLITPLDPAKLGGLPPGLVPDGNAYRIDLTYEPSARPVGTLPVPGDVIMTAPHNAAALLYSPDGQSWQKLASQAVGTPTTMGSSFSNAGYYVVATSPSALGGKTSSGSGAGTVLIAIWVVAGTVVLGLIAWVVAGRRREATRRRGRQGRRSSAR